MKITVKKLSELRKPEKNVRLHTAKQLEEYVRSLEMFGQIRPLVMRPGRSLRETDCMMPLSEWGEIQQSAMSSPG